MALAWRRFFPSTRRRSPSLNWCANARAPIKSRLSATLQKEIKGSKARRKIEKVENVVAAVETMVTEEPTAVEEKK